MKYIKRMIQWLLALPGYLLIGAIWIYKYTLSPYFPASCRFNPSCSDYGIQALKKHGVFKGTYLTVKRIGRCHPWGGSGYDPVP